MVPACSLLKPTSGWFCIGAAEMDGSGPVKRRSRSYYKRVHGRHFGKRVPWSWQPSACAVLLPRRAGAGRNSQQYQVISSARWRGKRCIIPVSSMRRTTDSVKGAVGSSGRQPAISNRDLTTPGAERSYERYQKTHGASSLPDTQLGLPLPARSNGNGGTGRGCFACFNSTISSTISSPLIFRRRLHRKVGRTRSP